MKYFLMRTGCVLLMILGLTAANGAAESSGGNLLLRLLLAGGFAFAGLMLGAAAEIMDPTQDPEEKESPSHAQNMAGAFAKNSYIKNDTTQSGIAQEGGRRCG